MLTPRLALMFDGSGVIDSVDQDQGGGTLVHAVETVAVQYWATSKFWLKGGLGAGQLSFTTSDGMTEVESELGPAAMIGVGYEVLRRTTFALDIHMRAAAATYSVDRTKDTIDHEPRDADRGLQIGKLQHGATRPGLQSFRNLERTGLLAGDWSSH